MKTLPSGNVVITKSSNMQFHCFACLETLIDVPKLLSSVIVTDKLEVKAFVLSASIPQSVFSHLLPHRVLSTTLELTNILAWHRSLAETPTSNDSSHLISMAAHLLEHYLEIQSSKSGHVEQTLSLVKFISEQLRLVHVSKNGRRYSVSMLTTCFLWQLTSTPLYSKLRDLFISPSHSRL